MRTNGRSLPALATALLLAASAAAVSGCGKPDGHPVLHRQGQAVGVIVMFDAATNKAVMSNKTIQLSLKHKDWAEWASPDGLVYVTFATESPFDNPPKHERKVLKSGPPKQGTVGKGFDYAAELWLDAEGKNRVKIDPRIEIVE